MAEKLVLDTSAWLALDEAEPGASDVEAILAAAWLGEKQVFTCFVTLTELDYIRTREHDAQQAAELLAFARAQRVTWIHSDTPSAPLQPNLKPPTGSHLQTRLSPPSQFNSRQRLSTKTPSSVLSPAS